MVRLLIRKKNENITWEWDEIHKLECLKYFKIENQYSLSETRFMIELSKLNP